MIGIWGWLWLQQIFAVGDAGALTEKQVRLYSAFWQKHADSGDVLIWLGDNVYPHGLNATARAQRRWQRIVRVSRSFPGAVWLTPGNHDWKADTQGILRQAADIALFPPPTEPFSLLQKGVWTFLFLDSERIIRTQGKGFPWEKIDSLWQRYSRLVVILHHPPRTAGAHGGYFPWQAHLFPLRTLHPALYLPLPGVGTLFVLLRKAAHHPTDLSHPAYRALSDSLLQRAHRFSTPVLFLSGHDHNLQIHQIAPHSYALISGSGCKTEPLARRKALWGKSVVGLWKIYPTSLQAYALHKQYSPLFEQHISSP